MKLVAVMLKGGSVAFFSTSSRKDLDRLSWIESYPTRIFTRQPGYAWSCDRDGLVIGVQVGGSKWPRVSSDRDGRNSVTGSRCNGRRGFRQKDWQP